MTTQKYSLKKQLLTEEMGYIDEHPFFAALRNYVDEADGDYDSAFVALRHSDGCSTEAYIALNDEYDKGGIWIDKMEVVNSERHLDPECLRKGYAKKMLEALTKAADETGTPLALIAASEAYYKRMYPGIDLPDKNELAALYGDYGFNEIYSNHAQVKMDRAPKSWDLCIYVFEKVRTTREERYPLEDPYLERSHKRESENEIRQNV